MELPHDFMSNGQVTKKRRNFQVLRLYVISERDIVLHKENGKENLTVFQEHRSHKTYKMSYRDRMSDSHGRSDRKGG